MKTNMKLAASDSVWGTPDPILARMNKEAEIPEALAMRLQQWAADHGMSFETAVELAVLMRWEQSHHSVSADAATGLSVLPPPQQDA
jgi:hypothetical protein